MILLLWFFVLFCPTSVVILPKSWEKARVLCPDRRCAAPQWCHRRGDRIQCQEVCGARFHLAGTGTPPAAFSAGVVVPLGRFASIVMAKSCGKHVTTMPIKLPWTVDFCQCQRSPWSHTRFPSSAQQGSLCGTNKWILVKTSPLLGSVLPAHWAWCSWWCGSTEACRGEKEEDHGWAAWCACFRTLLFPDQRSNLVKAKGHHSSSQPSKTPGPVWSVYLLARKEVLCPLSESR